MFLPVVCLKQAICFVLTRQFVFSLRLNSFLYFFHCWWFSLLLSKLYLNYIFIYIFKKGTKVFLPSFLHVCCVIQKSSILGINLKAFFLVLTNTVYRYPCPLFRLFIYSNSLFDCCCIFYAFAYLFFFYSIFFNVAPSSFLPLSSETHFSVKLPFRTPHRSSRFAAH